MMREKPIFTETSWRGGPAPLKESVAIAHTRGNTLELHVLHHQAIIGTEGLVNDVYDFRAGHTMVSTLQRVPSMTMWKCPFGFTLVPRPLSILLVLESCGPPQ